MKPRAQCIENLYAAAGTLVDLVFQIQVIPISVHWYPFVVDIRLFRDRGLWLIPYAPNTPYALVNEKMLCIGNKRCMMRRFGEESGGSPSWFAGISR